MSVIKKKIKNLSDLQVGDMVILCTADTRYEDEKKFIKTKGPKWITLESDYHGVKYHVKSGVANDKRPGFYIKVPETEYEKEWYSIANYLIEEVAPRYLYTLDLDKLKHLQRRWTNKILEYDEQSKDKV